MQGVVAIRDASRCCALSSVHLADRKNLNIPECNATAVAAPYATPTILVPLFPRGVVNRCFRHSCTRQAAEPLTSPPSDDIVPERHTMNLLKIATRIGVATTLSKLLGLLRELVVAAVFGVGPVVTALSYSSIIPLFFISQLGGVNGPFHSTLTASLSKCSKSEGKILVERLSLCMGLVCTTISILVFVFAAPLVDSVAPGLMAMGLVHGSLTRKLAILQLKVMAPCIMAAAFIGISFGSLSAVGIYEVPSLSPSLSSIAIIAAVFLHALKYGKEVTSSQNLMTGGLTLAVATTIGVFAQWAMQAYAKVRAGFGFLSIRWTNPLEHDDVREVLFVMIPAVITSSMLQVAAYTDLYFASYIPEGAAYLGYANLLITAPLGIVSSSLLIPMMRVFSSFSKSSQWLELQKSMRQGLILCTALTLCMTAILMPLAQPIVRILFQRFAFDSSATDTVSSLLKLYALGSPFSLARDLLVRGFHALGEGVPPFLISMAAIFANAVMDWSFVQQAGLGVEGLVLATMIINIFSVGALFLIFFQKIGGTKLKHWLEPSVVLIVLSVVASKVTGFAFSLCKQLVSFVLRSPSQQQTLFGTRFWIAELCSILLSTIVGAVSFFLPLWWLKDAESLSLLKILR